MILCPCHSAKPSRILLDARGIYVARVCDECEPRTRKKYRQDIFTDPNYWTEYGEPADEE